MPPKAKVASARQTMLQRARNISGRGPIPSFGVQPLGRGAPRSRPARGLPGVAAPRRRYRRGKLALRQIKRLQKGTDLLLPKAPFERLVRELAVQEMAQIRFQRSALEALQEAAEAFLCHMFGDVNLCALHAKRLTVQKRDVDLWKMLVGPFGG